MQHLFRRTKLKPRKKKLSRRLGRRQSPVGVEVAVSTKTLTLLWIEPAIYFAEAC